MRIKEILMEEEDISPAAIECRTQIGPLLSAVQETTEIFKPNLIIMGTHGASGLEKTLIGTNSYSVMKNSSTPVLAVPENTKFKPLRSLVFSTDYKPIEQTERLTPIAWIARQFGAVIKILHVTQKDKIADVKVAAEGLKLHHFLDGLSHHFFFVENESVEKGITSFIEQQACDLLVMVIHDRPFFERVFHASVARKIVMQGKIPILTLHA